MEILEDFKTPEASLSEEDLPQLEDLLEEGELVGPETTDIGVQTVAMAFDLGLSGMYRYKSEQELADWLVDYYDPGL